MAEQDHPVVLAVGHDPVDAALAFAADEAVRAGARLHLVHVLHELAQGPGSAVVVETDLVVAGRGLLNAVLERATDLVSGQVPVTTELRSGWIVHTLVRLSTDARMVVLQHRELSAAKRLITRSVASGVAARVRIPVASVPSGWTPPPAASRVVVGIDEAAQSREVLRAAAAAARSRGAPLTVLHTWSLEQPYGFVVISPEEDERLERRATKEIRAELTTLADELRGVTVTIEARHAHAADALVAAGRDSELLVLGRHDPRLPLGSHLGPVVRAVLRDTVAPVLLVDPRGVPEPGHARS